MDLKNVTLAQIKQGVVEFFGKDAGLIDSNNRRFDVIERRFWYYFMSKELTNKTLTQIADGLKAKRHHASVLHGINIIEDRLSVYPSYSGIREGILKSIKGCVKFKADKSNLCANYPFYYNFER